MAKILDRIESIDDFEEVINQSMKIQTLLDSYQIPSGLAAAISGEIHRLKESGIGNESGYAVRSSATIEDREDISFAGQAESYLCKRDTQDIIEAVKQVWKSAYSPKAAIYLKTKGISINCVKMAVLIQEMIPARISGVMFTANVVNNRKDEILINATWGLGEPLVSGRVIPDTYVLSKNPMKVLLREIGTKEIISNVRFLDKDVKNITSRTSKEMRNVLTLDEPTLRRVAEVGLEIEKEMGSPQDIEWCIKSDGEIVILQSRPITTLKTL